jgi:hypothetical protein
VTVDGRALSGPDPNPASAHRRGSPATSGSPRRAA